MVPLFLRRASRRRGSPSSLRLPARCAGEERVELRIAAVAAEVFDLPDPVSRCRVLREGLLEERYRFGPPAGAGLDARQAEIEPSQARKGHSRQTDLGARLLQPVRSNEGDDVG